MNSHADMPSSSQTDTDIFYMREALREAEDALSLGEVPVGAVIVRNGAIIAHAGNRRETDHAATAHAELSAIEQACRRVGSWRLSDCTLYVTLEPCPMCAGAIINARIRRVVFGAKDAKAGAMGSVLQMLSYPLNHRPALTEGVLRAECAAILSAFFEEKRNK